MKGTLTLDAELSDCVVGEPKSVTLNVTPTANGPDGFTADVSGVENYEEHGEDKKESKPYPAKGMDKHAPAVAIVISSGKKK